MTLKHSLHKALKITLPGMLLFFAPLWAQTTLASTSTQAKDIAKLFIGHPIVLLGEVHDNPDGHRLRYEALAAATDQGWRPVIVMEQFDREHQADLDEAQQSCGQDAECVIHIASPDKSGWDWALYRPVITLALRYKLPIIAANVSRADGAKIVREGFGAVFDASTLQKLHLNQPLPVDLDQEQTQAVRDGHCNLLPEKMLPDMVRAQVARDVIMATALEEYAKDRGAVLLAGNGHVRRDLGAPRWLSAQAAQTALSVGFVEQTPAADNFDRFYVVTAKERGNPCNSLARTPIK